MAKVARRKTGVTAAFLHECYTYDPETGLLTWQKTRPLSHFLNSRTMLSNNSRWGGKVAGALKHPHKRASDKNYVMVWVGPYRYGAHRVIWAMVHNIDLDDVPEFLDHVDGYGDNNRLSNIRKATKAQNSWNRGLNSNNTSGFKGVCYRVRDDKYEASLHFNGTDFWLGSYETAEEAGAAYAAAAEKLHGDFLRLK